MIVFYVPDYRDSLSVILPIFSPKNVIRMVVNDLADSYLFGVQKSVPERNVEFIQFLPICLTWQNLKKPW